LESLFAKEPREARSDAALCLYGSAGRDGTLSGWGCMDMTGKVQQSMNWNLSEGKWRTLSTIRIDESLRSYPANTCGQPKGIVQNKGVIRTATMYAQECKKIPVKTPENST